MQGTTSAKLDNCDVVNFQLDSGDWVTGVALGTATGADTSYSRTTTLQTITASDSIATVSAEFHAD